MSKSGTTIEVKGSLLKACTGMGVGMAVLMIVGILLLIPAQAWSHSIECEKTVNGQKVLSLRGENNGVPSAASNKNPQGDIVLNYRLVLRNRYDHTSSTVRGVGDPVGEAMGLEVPDTWFQLAPGEERAFEYSVTLESPYECAQYDLIDGLQDSTIVNTSTVFWPDGFDSCYAIVECPLRAEE